MSFTIQYKHLVKFIGITNQFPDPGQLWNVSRYFWYLCAVWVDDLESVVAGVCDPLYADHLPHVVDAAAADDTHKHVRHVGQALQHLFRLLGDGGEVGVRGDGTEKKKVKKRVKGLEE